MNTDTRWHTLREIDLAAGQAKGSAFRAFKRRADLWQEGRDFVVLDHERDADAIRTLRDSGRIHAGSINVILLSHPFADTLLEALKTLR